MTMMTKITMFVLQAYIASPLLVDKVPVGDVGNRTLPFAIGDRNLESSDGKDSFVLLFGGGPVHVDALLMHLRKVFHPALELLAKMPIPHAVLCVLGEVGIEN